MQNPRMRPVATSPLSMQSNDSAYLNMYTKDPGGDPYHAAAVKPSQKSPPLSASAHASGSTDSSLSSRPMTNRSASAANSHLSSASSISRASDGFYSPTVSEFGRNSGAVAGANVKPAIEDVLAKHYRVLKGYLATYIKDEQGNTRPNRARDKLLRLSSTQFHELSTDVYDELLRREDDRRRPGGGVPHFLPPKNVFHPKRNQARQKLSTLPPDRFRQLATDVFYELERRTPRLATMEGERPGSAAGSVRGPSRQSGPRGPPPTSGYRGPPPPGGMRRPSNASSLHYGGYSPEDGILPPRLDSRADSRAGSISQGSDMGRPMPQSFSSNNLIPNKSTMVEDDVTDEEDDVVGDLVRSRSSAHSEKDKERLQEYESQVNELQERVQELEEKLKAAETQVGTSKQREEELSHEKKEWTDTKAELDSRLQASQQSLENLHAELEQSHTDRSQGESDLRAETERTVSDLHLEIEEVRRENMHLRTQAALDPPNPDNVRLSEQATQDNEAMQKELETQRALTEEVRRNAEQFLQEMRLLSEQSELALEKEEQLRSQIQSLEQETEHWKSRYAKARTQIRSLKASSIGLGIQHESNTKLRNRWADGEDQGEHGLLRHDGSGLVRDVDVTTYQITIDELLYAARDANPELALEKTKPVIKAVRDMVAGVDGDFSAVQSPMRPSSPINGTAASANGSAAHHPIALKAKITRDANRLVTAARTHATSHGLAPVSLIDASASNLTASIVALLQVVGISPSSDIDLKHESLGSNVDSPEGRQRGFSEIAPLQLQPRSFADEPLPAPHVPYSDAGMESPIIKDGFAIRQEPPREVLPVEEKDKGKEPKSGGGIGGWFNMLKSPSMNQNNKSSMVESEGDGYSDDERYDYA